MILWKHTLSRLQGIVHVLLVITSVIKTIFPETIQAQTKVGLPNVDGGSDFNIYTPI